jgi:cell division protein FtsQ
VLRSALLGKARLEAEHLYAKWRVVSLARLNADAEIEVRTDSGATIVFSATTDYFTQIAKLDLTLDRLAAKGLAVKRIDLANGRDVTVTADLPVLPGLGKPTAAVPPRKVTPSGLPAFGNFSLPSKTNREF